MALRDNEDDCDLDVEATVQELLVNEGKAAVDGLDQHVTIKVIQQQAYSSRLSSTAPDLTPSHFRSSPRPPIPRFSQTESVLGKRSASVLDSPLVHHTAKRSRFDHDTILQENIAVASVETPPSAEYDDDLEAVLSKPSAPPLDRASPNASTIPTDGPIIKATPRKTDEPIQQASQAAKDQNKDRAIPVEEAIQSKAPRQPKVAEKSQSGSQVQPPPEKRKREEIQPINASSGTALKPLDMLSDAVKAISDHPVTSVPSQVTQDTVGPSPPEQRSQPSLVQQPNDILKTVPTVGTGGKVSVAPKAAEDPGQKTTKLAKQKDLANTASQLSESVPVKSLSSIENATASSGKKPGAKRKIAGESKTDIEKDQRDSTTADHGTNLVVNAAEVEVSDPKPAAPKSRISDLSTTDSPGEQLSGELQAFHENGPMSTELSKAMKADKTEPKKRGRPRKKTPTATEVTGFTKQGIPKSMSGRMRADAVDTDSSSAPKLPKPKKLSKKAQAVLDAAAAQNSSDTVRGSPEEPAKAAPVSQRQTLPKESSQNTTRILPPGLSQQEIEAIDKDWRASHPPEAPANEDTAAANAKKPSPVPAAPLPPSVIPDPKPAAKQAEPESETTDSGSSDSEASEEETSSSTSPEALQSKTQARPAPKSQAQAASRALPKTTKKPAKASSASTKPKPAPSMSTQPPFRAPVPIKAALPTEGSNLAAIRAALKSTVESAIPRKPVATTNPKTKKSTLAITQDDDDDEDDDSETESEAETEVSKSKAAPRPAVATAKTPIKTAGAAAATIARPDMSIRNKSPSDDDEDSGSEEEDESDDE